MQTRMMILGVATAIALATGCGSPEKKLSGSMEEMASIMEANLETPKEGAVKLREHMRDNLPGLLEAVGNALVELDKIDDPKARADRAAEMVKAMEAPMKKLQEVGMKFGMKAMTDEETQKYAEEIGKGWEETAKQLEGVLKSLGGGLASANPEAGERFHASL